MPDSSTTLDTPGCFATAAPHPFRSVDELLAALPLLDGGALDEAIRRVTDLKPASAAPDLLALMTPARANFAHSLAHGIATIGGDEACEGLLRVLADARSNAIRCAAAYGLTWLLDDRSFEPLLSVLADRSETPDLRAQAAEAINYLVGSDPCPDRRAAAGRVFEACLDESNDDVRYWSVMALGTMGTESALPKLRLLADGEIASGENVSPLIQAEAREALTLLQAADAA